MTNIPILDLVVGMIFIYFLFSIISSSAVEMILSGMKIRSEILGRWLLTIFNKPITQPDGEQVPLGQAIMDHCAITALSKDGKAPSYIGAKNFTSALLEKVTYAANPKNVAANIDDLMNAIQQSSVLPTDLQRLLLTYANEAKQTYAAVEKKTASEIDIFKNKIEHWYDTNMDRITGRLKLQYARPFTLAVAIATTLLLNADSIAIAKFLYGNPQVSKELAAQAIATTSDSNTIKMVNALRLPANDTAQLSQDSLINTIKKDVAQIKSTKAVLTAYIPLGWNDDDFKGNVCMKMLKHVPGWAMTVLAIVMGAPFWFDLLNKIANLRGSGAKPSAAAPDPALPDTGKTS